ncbi:hypothetical protein [Ammoniphilus resinae]|uniref:Glycosyltransferase RgtA/B/C/D-like domain-containing protein n=1 Tax=Ammoniphilus resinae TaxID=861532 RepID=A0ABS4GWW9_9BACL|nr:hypothetical protein [Ammoniphilus resinae]MBP1934770.1 hypothetical protein [Ammoniphilus resinae]
MKVWYFKNKYNNLFLLTVYLMSLIIFFYFLRQNSAESYYDELSYLNFSQGILSNGLFNTGDPLRTYLYPLIISMVSIFSNGNPIVIKVIISLFQYILYAFTIFIFSKSIYLKTNNKIHFFIIIFAGMLNPYLIQATTLLLTDLISSCLIIIALVIYANDNFIKFRNMCILFFLIYSSIMIRPSNLIFLIGFIIVVLVSLRKDVNFKFYKFVLASISMLFVFFPQFYMNVVFFNHWTPLVHENLYESQTKWAVQFLKYGSVVITGETPQLYYLNPFQLNNETTFFDTVLSEPFIASFLFLAHVFGILDWGYTDTYIREYYHTNRLFSSLFLYTCWYFIFIGIYLVILKRQIYLNKRLNRIIGAVLVLAMIFIVFIGTTCVESRFGYPLFIMLLPLLTLAYDFIISIKYKKSRFVIILILYLLFLALFFCISFYLDIQTSRINWFEHLNINFIK